MRALAMVLVLAGCIPQDVVSRASATLGVTAKHFQLESREKFAGGDVYTFCRSHGWFSPRMYDASCVMYVCDANAPASRCVENVF